MPPKISHPGPPANPRAGRLLCPLRYHSEIPQRQPRRRLTPPPPPAAMTAHALGLPTPASQHPQACDSVPRTKEHVSPLAPALAFSSELSQTDSGLRPNLPPRTSGPASNCWSPAGRYWPGGPRPRQVPRSSCRRRLYCASTVRAAGCPASAGPGPQSAAPGSPRDYRPHLPDGTERSPLRIGARRILHVGATRSPTRALSLPQPGSPVSGERPARSRAARPAVRLCPPRAGTAGSWQDPPRLLAGRAARTRMTCRGARNRAGSAQNARLRGAV